MKIKVIRSFRRRKTVAAKITKYGMELRVPAFLPKTRVDYFVRLFSEKLRKKKVARTNKFLYQRASYLYKKFFKKNVENFSIYWSSKQRRIFGVCNHKERTIRISARLKKVPQWVLDYVILHELSHLSYPNHGKKFWQMVKQYPKTDRARGFLQGMNFLLDN